MQQTGQGQGGAEASAPDEEAQLSGAEAEQCQQELQAEKDRIQGEQDRIHREMAHFGFASLSKKYSHSTSQASRRSTRSGQGEDGDKEGKEGKPDKDKEDAKKDRPGVFAVKSDAKAIYGLLKGSYMNIGLLVVPFAIAAHLAHWGSIAVFVLAFFALIPLALLLGNVTEDLALRFGQTVGGLLNATFGNVTELILAIAALVKGLFTVVAMSLIGSVLSNLLLVLGCSFLVGGTKYKEQSFNAMVNKACCSLLLMACIAISIPTAAHFIFKDDKSLTDAALTDISHAVAIVLALIYGMYLLFQLKTHSSLMGSDDEDEEEQPKLSLSGGVFILTIITVLVAVMSEFLTGAIEDVSKLSNGKLGEAFLGLIVLPIAGNAAEHITAVMVAHRGKLDLSIGVALGSSVQIATFVLPVVVLVGWIIKQPLSLAFDPLSVLLLTLSVLHAYFVSADGMSNWLMGVQLIATYILIALLYLLVPGIKAGSDLKTGGGQ